MKALKGTKIYAITHIFLAFLENIHGNKNVSSDDSTSPHVSQVTLLSIFGLHKKS